uniref:mannan endo-1,4-beta-mannosidase n=1 Tax=Cajanus cajan TaxID=3821 RepID=A0A151SS75_CAJCA|nr:Mannan endo-1,4-beta-mannosidase 1 [Cajanus cajan]
MGLQNLVLIAFTVALVDGGSAFVQRNATHFILNGKPYYLNGFNAYWLMYMASDPSTSSKVTSIYQQASQHGLNVARTMAFNDGTYRALQISPGSYDETVFKTKNIFWCNFYAYIITINHFLVVGLYFGECVVMLSRNNTITGKIYKDDQTIFAWELMNEPRVQNDLSGKSFQVWVNEMAAYVKSLDSNHLLEIGLEGFYGESMPQKKRFNPAGFQSGTDFISNNQLPQIDFATIHLYPDQWLVGFNETAQNVFGDEWVKAHIEDSSDVLGKPIVLTEFGFSSKSYEYSVGKRDNYFEKLYNMIYSSASRGGPCAGGLFWQLLAGDMSGFGDGYEVIFGESPSTTNIITQQSKNMFNIK